ncbi:unnamed protein product [Cylindrotheca closterium]|uniref:Helicase-associated domain-containing protein n=1 Tax=Cylindrotheca closterium TaxID=2856 RepID=A0AAD2CKU0_9STRA|nr:unnamed protein product [Cylindrotheca closterium]
MILKPPLNITQTIKVFCLFHLSFQTTCKAFHVGEAAGPMKLSKRGHCHSLNLSAAGFTILDSDYGYGNDDSYDDEYAIGSSSTSNNPAWEIQFQNLKRFHQEHGHVNVPQHPSEEIQQKYPKLASFCKNQRSLYNKHHNGDSFATTPLPPIFQSRKERLQSLGFDFDIRQSVWDSKYDEMYAFWKKHGHFKVKKLEHPDLYSWMYYQRQRYKYSDKNYKPLTDEQIARLENINFCWNPKEEEWWNNFHALKRHQEQHGNLVISDSKLRPWKNSLRRTCREYVMAVTVDGTTKDVHVSGLNARRLEALREIRFCWLPKHHGVLREVPPDDIFDGYQ